MNLMKSYQYTHVPVIEWVEISLFMITTGKLYILPVLYFYIDYFINGNL